MPINQESTCPTDFPGISLRQKQNKPAWCYHVWGPFWATSLLPQGPTSNSYPLMGTTLWPSGKKSSWQYRRCWFEPWVGKIPWRRKWQPTPIFLPGKSQGQRSLVAYSPWSHKDTIEHTSRQGGPGHHNRPEANPRARKEAGRRQITAVIFMMCFMTSKPLKAHYVLWSLQHFSL